jgi:Flp pilus assembly protein TadD
MRQSRFTDAVRDFITGSRLAPSEAPFSYGAGRAFSRMGQYAEAVVQYGEAIRLAPNDSDAILSRAEALIRLGQYAQARNDYDRALTLGLTRALEDYEAALRISPNDGWISASIRRIRS